MALALLLAALTAQSLAAEATAEQRAQARSVDAALKKCANLIRSAKHADAGEAFLAAHKDLQELGRQPEAATLVAPLRKQYTRLREMLVNVGVTVPQVDTDVAADPKTDGKPTGKVSFVKQVAPLLVERCGGCHVQRARGEFSMASYVSLAKGSADGSVIMAGDGKGSRLIEVIVSGDMPRGGGAKLPPEDIELLTKWINEGAKFDGPDSAAPLTSFAATAAPTKVPKRRKVRIDPADPSDKIRFTRDVGPLVVEHCLGCHGGRNPRAGFSATTFERLLQGGDNGPVIVAGMPAESLIVKKLKGTAGARMPLNTQPLDDDEIRRFEDWIAAGAKFDGGDAEMALAKMIDEAAARDLSHDQLRERRRDLAAKNWRLILPDSPGRGEQTDDLLVYGAAPTAVLAEAASMAQQQVARLRKLYKLPADRPLVKGGLTLFAFEKRYDYGEVGTMLEHRELPSSWRAHWHFNPLDTYGCVLLSDGQASPGLMMQPIAGAFLASLPEVPHWFAEGTARALAAKAEPKDPRVKQWDDQVPRILVTAEKPGAFLDGDMPPEQGDILSYSFAKQLMTNASKHSALVTALVKGQAFDEAFEKTYGAGPEQLVPAWAARAKKRGK